MYARNGFIHVDNYYFLGLIHAHCGVEHAHEIFVWAVTRTRPYLSTLWADTRAEILFSMNLG